MHPHEFLAPGRSCIWKGVGHSVDKDYEERQESHLLVTISETKEIELAEPLQFPCFTNLREIRSGIARAPGKDDTPGLDDDGLDHSDRERRRPGDRRRSPAGTTRPPSCATSQAKALGKTEPLCGQSARRATRVPLHLWRLLPPTKG